MIAQDLIQIDLSPLSPTDTVSDALREMEANGVLHLPIVKEEIYEGMISEDTALEVDEAMVLEELRQRFQVTNVQQDQHVLEAVKKYGEDRISILPVVNAEQHYLGYILPQDVLHAIGGLFSLQAPGSILVLEVNQSDFSMAQIAQIVESNDAKILASYLHAHPGNDTFEITVRLNFSDLSAIISAFERYDYKITQAWHENRYEQDLKKRFDQFMNYLNM